jgi:predicted metalloprotease with PDZ domain
MHTQQSLIHYYVNVSCISGHIFDVNLRIENPDVNGQILTLPAWIPGSYMIRDFAKNIITISAKDDAGQEISIMQINVRKANATGFVSLESGDVYAH